MNAKGGSTLEFLLILGGAILLASLTVMLLPGSSGVQKDQQAAEKCASLPTCEKCVGDKENACIAAIKTAAEDRTATEISACTLAQTESFKYCDTTKAAQGQ